MKVQYDEGPAARTIASTGQVAERGVPLEIDPAVGQKLLKQGWREASKTPTATKKAATSDPVEKETK